MIFEALWDSSRHGELILINGGYCRFHLRRDGQVTILEIISTRQGAGSEMLEQLKAVEGARSIFAKCPCDLASNAWYRKRGFKSEGNEKTKSGRVLNLWRLPL